MTSSVLLTLIGILLIIVFYAIFSIRNKPSKYMEDPVIQQLKGYQNWINLIPLFCTVVGTVVAIVLTNNIDKQVNKRIATLEAKEKAEKAESGTLHSKAGIFGPPERTTVMVGSHAYVFDTEKLEAGQSIFHTHPDGKEFFVFFIRSNNGKAQVHVTLRGDNLDIIANISENQWMVTPSSYVVRNYDSSAFEVTDKKGIQKLQVDLVYDNFVEITGLVKTGQYYLLMARRENGGLKWIDQDIVIRQSNLLPNIFKYRHLGVRERKSLFKNPIKK